MNQKAQAGLEYLMTYGWALIMIATVIGVLVFIVGTPVDEFTCTVSDPQKFVLKGYSIPSSGYGLDAGYDQWKTDIGTPPYNSIVLQNLTGGRITIDRIESFIGTNPEVYCPIPGPTGFEFSTANQKSVCFDGRCQLYEVQEGWIDMGCATTAYIHNYNNSMTINGICQACGNGSAMCQDGEVVEVKAGELIKMENFTLSAQKCVSGKQGGSEPGKIRFLYTDQLGLSDYVTINCTGTPKKP